MSRRAVLLFAVVFNGCVVSGVRADPAAEVGPVSYYRDIRPIFQASCHGCHQPAKASGEYTMTTAEALLRGGESEQVAIVPGKPEESYLLEQITPEDGVAAMPQEGEPLDERQIDLVRRWIAKGAVDDTPASAGQRFDAEHPPEYRRLPVIPSVDFSPDGSLLAVAGFHEVLLHKISFPEADDPTGISTSLVVRLVGMSERIESVRFSPDGTRLAVTGGLPARMGEVQIWDVAAHELLLSIPVLYDTVYGASWSADGKLLAFGCPDSSVRAIDSSTGEQVLFQGAHSDWVVDTVFSADDTHLASVGRDATAKLIEVPTQRFVDNITSITPGASRGGINAVARHPQRDEILFGGADGMPKIYRMQRTTKRVIGDDANLLWELPSLPGRLFAVDYSQDGKLIAAGSSLDGAGAVHLYGIEAEPKISEEINKILIKPTHTRSAEERKKLQQHFSDGIRVIAEHTIKSGGIYAVSISPDARHVAAAGADGQVRLIDAESGAIVHEFAPVELILKTDEDDTSNRGAVAVASNKPKSPTEEPKQQDDSAAAEALPQDAKIVRLLVEPETVELRSATDYVHAVVSAELDTGDTIDVTRQAHWKADSPIVHVSATGLISPSLDGATVVTVAVQDQTATIDVEVAAAHAELQPDYLQDVAPILARVGCNAGTCHGAQDGKNGFKLSLRGYDPLYDLRALTDDAASRRINLSSPAQSLMLLKPTASVAHEGGQVLTVDSNYYQTLLAWIRSGAKFDLDAPRVTGIEVRPINPVVQAIGARQQMRVVANYVDGTQRDVTREAFVESGDTDIATPVDHQPGLMEVLRRGEAPVLVRYEGAYAATTITVMGDRTGFTWSEPPANNHIDDLVHTKLERTKTSPAPLCDDYTLVRRVYLDLTGLPPTPEQLSAFIEDDRDSRWKRNQLIDQLVGSSEYVEHWTNKWADLLQVNSKFLGREGAEAFRAWIRTNIQANTPYDEFARKVLTSTGSTKDNPAGSYYKTLREPEAIMENTTHLFLSTRFNCNKCHDHPFERWTQDQYYQLSAFFARVGLKKDPASGDKKIGGTAVEGAKSLYEIVFTKTEGEVAHLRTGKTIVPEFPFACDHQCSPDMTRVEKLAAWITSSDNPYFATSYANRLWAYLTGRGLIEPIDDIRAGNPPSNPQLLQWLTQQLIESGFNTQHLIRTICRSRTYQRALTTNQFNEDDQINYSHAKARRLPAEVLYDAIYQTTGAQSNFPGVAKGIRAAALPDVGIQLADGFLNNLGRPARESACECERTNEMQLGPVMALINGATVGSAISQTNSAIEKLVAEIPDDRRLLQRLFLRILNRPGREDEIADVLEIINQIEKEHQQTLKQLVTYKAELAPIVEERKQERKAKLAAQKAELAAYEVEIAPERQRLKEEREQRIAEANATQQQVRAALIEKLPAWVDSHRNDTAWQALNPVEISSSSNANLRVLEDRSVFVKKADGSKSLHQLIAPADLTGITGIRLDAISDGKLSRYGPGRAPDGNFVLTELKLETAIQDAKPQPLVRHWDFSDSSEDWKARNHSSLTHQEGLLVVEHEDSKQRLFVKTEAPSTTLALEMTAKFDSNTDLKLFWTTAAHAQFDQARSASRRVTPGSTKSGCGAWRTYRVYFHPHAAITGLRLDIDGGGTRVLFDAIRLVEAEHVGYSEVVLQNAQADFSQQEHSVTGSIDGKVNGNNNGWAISPQTGKHHLAVFETADDYSASGSGSIRVKMFYNYSTGVHSIGRYRVSITRSPRPLSFGLPQEILDIIAIDKENRSEEQQAALIEYYLQWDTPYLGQRAKIAKAEEPVPPDAKLEQLKRQVARLSEPLPVDAKLVRLERAAKLSTEQMAQKRLTAAQDVVWALINSPEFLYNH